MSNKYTQIYPVCLEWTCLLICREFAYNFWIHSAIRKACVWSYFGRNSKVEGSACQAPRFLAKGLRNWTDGKPDFTAFTWKTSQVWRRFRTDSSWLVDSIDYWFYVQRVKLQLGDGLVERHLGNCFATLSSRKPRTSATWLNLRWRKSGRLWILLRVSELQTDHMIMFILVRIWLNTSPHQFTNPC